MQAPLMFHKDVFIPDFARQVIHGTRLTYGRHALNVSAGAGPGFEAIALPRVLDVTIAVLVEVEVNPRTGAIEKQVWRMPLNADTDICFPMLPDGFVKTVWLNARTDQHSTLRRDRYTDGYAWRRVKSKVLRAARTSRDLH